MTITVLKNNLQEAVRAAERATSENAHLPILRNVLIAAEKNGITLSATNLEISVRATLPGKVIAPGSVSIPLGVLSGVINNLPSEKINLEAISGNLRIVTESYEGTILGLPVEDFPIIPKRDHGSEHIAISGAELREALQQVVIATQPSDLRPELVSVLLDFSVDALKFAATDSFRLAEKTLGKQQFQATYKNEFKVLLPLKTAHELLRIVKDDDEATLSHDRNQWFCTTKRFELTSRLIDGNFPDYQAIIPNEFKAEVVVNREELLQALKLVGIISNRNNEVHIKLLDDKKTLEVSSVEQVVGEHRYVLHATIEGEPLDVVFNSKSLGDACRALTSDELFFGIHEEHPALIRDAKERSYFYILAPITV